MEAASTRLLAEFWLGELGCSSQDLQQNKTTIVPHGTLKGYAGLYFFRQEGACIVSAPESFLDRAKCLFGGLRPSACFDPSFIASELADRLERIVGPAWIGKVDGHCFRPCHGPDVRQVEAADWPLLDQLLKAADSREAEDSALEQGRKPVMGVFADGTLAAAAGYEILLGKVAHIGVLTHPAHRGKGFAAQAISAITEHALQSGLGIQYQTLCANTPSLRAAEKVGFQKYAETIAARLR